ncbi:MAG: ATPase domain-containing protein [Actinomycetota bacterium]
MERLETGIANLDLITGGGFPLGSLVVLAGSPGTGKTVLAQQICFAAAARGRRALYFTTLSEPHSKLISHLEQFRFFDAHAIATTVDIVNVAQLAAEKGLGALAAEVVRRSFDEEPAVVVIDSSKALHEMGDYSSLRSVLYDMASRVAHSEAVLFLVGEYSLEDVGRDPEFAVADGIVYLANESHGPFDQRWLRVLKMRGSDYLSGKHSFRITSDGVAVFPRLEATTPPRAEAPKGRVSTGVPALDGMMGGGIPAASSTLVAGPSGAGKTVLGLHFVEEGLRRGERCLYLSLQETSHQLVAKARAFGWDFSAPLKSGLLSIRYVQPVELEANVLGSELRASVLEGPVQRVVIDSVAELEHAAREEGRFLDYLWSAVELIRSVGASCLLTSETEAFFGPTFSLARGASPVADNIILLRYTEVASDIRRALNVSKMRDSDHVKSLVEFEIGNRGIKILSKFEGMSGVLTGSPLPTSEKFREFFGR